MYAAYVFSLVLGGGFLLLSVLGDILGGDASDMAFDVDVDVDVDLDVHMDVDVDVDGDVGAHDWALVSKIFSFRMVVYTLFGFGAVGWVLSYLGFAPAAPLTIAYAAVGGLGSGTLVNRAFAYLRRTETGMLEEDNSFVGLAGDITLPLGGGSTGKVAIEILVITSRC